MSSLKLTFFGSPQIEYNGERVELETRKSLALLAFIATTKHAQSREKLASVFWPESPSDKAFTNLRRTLWSLKQKLTDQWLDIRRQTIDVKHGPTLWVDINQFHQYLDQATGHDHTTSTACDTCLHSLVAAIELYKDDFLRGFTLSDSPSFDDWQFFQTDQLRGKLLESVKRVVRYYASQHDLQKAIQYARQWVTLSLWEETAHRELMRLYVLNNQRSAALQQYQECVRILKEEFNADPEQQTKDLFEAIMQQKMKSAVPQSNEPQPYVFSLARVESPHTYQATPFIGRTQELETITRLLLHHDCRVLTLLGLGGIGKTRLAQHIMPEVMIYYPDGVYFLPLGAITSSEFFLSALADTLRFAPSTEGDYQQAFLRYVKNKKLLLILDNFEHLLPDTEPLLEILKAAPEVQLLVTSRERLKIREEWVYEIGGLVYPLEGHTNGLDTYPVNQLPEAVQLFVQTARRLYSDFVLSKENTPSIVRLCQLVEGMPLALELAASWCKLLSCQQIVEEIERSFDFLSSQTTVAEPRHQSVRAVFESIWKQLSDLEQSQLCKLSLFQGSFNLQAAEAIAGTSLPHIAALADRSLIQCRPESRFELHMLLKRFLFEKLRENPEVYTTTYETFSGYYCDFLRQQEQRLKTEEQPEALQDISKEIATLRYAWNWTLEHDQSQRIRCMMPALSLFYDMQSRFQEGKDLFRQAVEQLSRSNSEQRDPLLFAQIMIQDAVFSRHLVHDQDVTPLYQAALPLLKAHHNRDLALTHIKIGWMKSWHPLEKDEAEEWIISGKQLAETKGDAWEIALALFVQGDLAYWGKIDYEESKSFYQQCLEIRQRIGDRWGQASALNSLGHVALISGLYQEAQWFHREALRICQNIGDLHGIAWAKGRLAEIAINLGDYQRAWRLCWEVHKLSVQFGNQGITAWRLVALSKITFMQEQYDETFQHLQKSLLLFKQVRHRQGPAWTLLHLGQLYVAQSHLEEAQKMFQESLAIFKFHENRLGEAAIMYTMGIVHFISGNYRQAFEGFLISVRTAYEKNSLFNLVQHLFGLGYLLTHTAASDLGVEVLAFIHHHPATPYDVKQRIKTFFAKQERLRKHQDMQTMIETGKMLTVDQIMAHINELQQSKLMTSAQRNRDREPVRWPLVNLFM